MPSNLPRFTIRTDQEIIDKIAYIANENDRSTTQQIINAIKKSIKEYEQEHGTIELPEQEASDKSIK